MFSLGENLGFGSYILISMVCILIQFSSEVLAGDTYSRVLNYFTVQRNKDYHKPVLDLSSACSSFSAILFRVVTSICACSH